MFVILSLSGYAAALRLPDTGNARCYQLESPYAEIPCLGTGQDGAYSINPMSYTDNGNGTVTDNNTRLMWQRLNDGSKYNWYRASGTYNATSNPSSQNVCGAMNLGGHTDWRLPTKKELMSIVDYSVPYPGPTIMSAFFPNTVSSGYWSSTTFASSPARAWSVDFYDGTDASGSFKETNGYVRCVRNRL
jgi:hypothetical protein